MFKHFSILFCFLYFVLNHPFITNPCSERWGFSLLFLIISYIWHFKLKLQMRMTNIYFEASSPSPSTDTHKVSELVKKKLLSNVFHQLPQFCLLYSPTANSFFLKTRLWWIWRRKTDAVIFPTSCMRAFMISNQSWHKYLFGISIRVSMANNEKEN